MLLSLEFLHSIKYSHTDLKPENIVFKYKEIRKKVKDDIDYYLPKRMKKVKLIDFGNAYNFDEFSNTTINTRQFRAPEVILETRWNEKNDIWSLGCILMELYNSELLFKTHNTIEHLMLIEKIIGPFDLETLSKYQKQGINNTINLIYKDNDLINYEINKSIISKLENDEFMDKVAKTKSLTNMISEKDEDFLGLIKGMLEFNYEKRFSCQECLNHNFFSKNN